MYPFVQDLLDSRKTWIFELDGKKLKEKKRREREREDSLGHLKKEKEENKDTAALLLHEVTINSTCG